MKTVLWILVGPENFLFEVIDLNSLQSVQKELTTLSQQLIKVKMVNKAMSMEEKIDNNFKGLRINLQDMELDRKLHEN